MPQWSYLYQDSQAGSQPPSPKEILLQALAWWPYFAHEMRALHLAKGASRVAMLDLVKKFTEVRGLLDEVGTVLQELLAAGTSIRYVDSRHSDPLFPIVLEYEDRTLAWVFMLHACYTLALDYMFIAAREYSPFTYACPFPESLFAATRGERVEELCMRIFQSCEYIQQFAPLGHGFIQPALYTAYHYAIDEELKAWVLKSLNDTESFQGQSESLYTDALAKWFFELETGEMPLRTMK